MSILPEPVRDNSQQGQPTAKSSDESSDSEEEVVIDEQTPPQREDVSEQPERDRLPVDVYSDYANQMATTRTALGELAGNVNQIPEDEQPIRDSFMMELSEIQSSVIDAALDKAGDAINLSLIHI